MARLIVMRKGGGGKVAVNPDLVTHVRSASGPFTDIFFEGQQVAVEGAFEEVVARLSAPDRKPVEGGPRREEDGDRRADGSGLVIGRAGAEAGAMFVTAALQAALAFNLTCTGTERAGPLGLALPDNAATPIEISYRIDLDQRRWCSDACDETEELGGVVLAQILLRDRHSPEGSHVIIFNPATGMLTDTLNRGDRMVLRHATCVRAAFTGFPGLSA